MADVRIYQDAQGGWIVWDGYQKHRFATEAEARLYYRRLTMAAEQDVQKLLEKAGKSAQDMLMAVQQAMWMVDANGIEAQLASADPAAPFGASDWTPAEWMARLGLVRAFLAWAQTPLDANDPASAPIKAFYKR